MLLKAKDINYVNCQRVVTKSEKQNKLLAGGPARNNKLDTNGDRLTRTKKTRTTAAAPDIWKSD